MIGIFQIHLPTNSVKLVIQSALLISQFKNYKILKPNGLNIWRKQKNS